MSVGNTLTNVLVIIAFVLFPNLGGFAGGFIAQNNMDWLNRCVKKPPAYPPSYVFGPVWTILYSGIGYASYLVFDSLRPDINGFDKTAVVSTALFLIQMTFNWIWTPIFFGFHSFSWSAVDLIATLITAAACGFAFGNIQLVAGLIFIPYVIWLCFASYINIAIYLLNKNPKIIATTGNI